MDNFHALTQALCRIAITALIFACIYGGSVAYTDIREIFQLEAEQRIATMKQFEKQSKAINMLVSEITFFVAASALQEQSILSVSEAEEMRVQSINNLEQGGQGRIAKLLRAVQNVGH